MPITAEAALFREAVELGREVIWLHCFGERFADPVTGQPAVPPRLRHLPEVMPTTVSTPLRARNMRYYSVGMLNVVRYEESPA